MKLAALVAAISCFELTAATATPVVSTLAGQSDALQNEFSTESHEQIPLMQSETSVPSQLMPSQMPPATFQKSPMIAQAPVTPPMQRFLQRAAPEMQAPSGPASKWLDDLRKEFAGPRALAKAQELLSQLSQQQGMTQRPVAGVATGSYFAQKPMERALGVPSPTQDINEVQPPEMGGMFHSVDDDGGDEDEEDVDDASAANAAMATMVRPGASAGVADVVSFAMFAKSFFGASLKYNQFRIDFAMLLKWKDPRVVKLIPQGMDEMTLSKIEALTSIWMPEVVVTNRAIKKFEVISTTVVISRTGDVRKVERAVAICQNIYQLKEYPFDTQKLNVKIASSKYMLDEVVLQPLEDSKSNGVRDNLMKGFPYELKKWRVYAFDETDGALKKSRGVLELTVRRTFDKYGENHMMPAILFLIISCGVFRLPFAQPFCTPRLALSVLALLSFTNVIMKSSAELPGGAPMNWNDVFNNKIQGMMFCTIVLNIAAESCRHQWKFEELAVQINNEAKLLVPALSTVVIIIVMTAGYYKYMSVEVGKIVTEAIIGVCLGTYLVTRFMAFRSHHQAAKSARENAESKA